MRRWSLKTKVSVYCLFLTAIALLGTAVIIFPIVYSKQLNTLDESLRDNAKQLFEEIDNKYPNFNPASLARKPFSIKIPTSLTRRYIAIEYGNTELYRAKIESFKDINLQALGEGAHTIPVPSKDPQMPTKDARLVKEHFGSFTIWMGTRLGVLDDTQSIILYAYLFTIPTAMVLVFFGARILAGRALGPVTAMTAAAERIGANAPDERLPVPQSNDEILRLTVVLNESFDRLQRAYNSAARFSADASHQLKTPIAVLRAGLDELRICGYLEPMERETVDTLVQQTRRLTTLVEDLLLLAQADAGRLKIEPQPIDLTPILSTVMDDTEALGDERQLVVTLHAPAQLYAKGDPRRINIILQNLTENAVKYNRPHGKLRMSARREGPWVYISVANTGPAIPDQYRDRLFERFNRAGMGENIKGHGLGLNIARELARAHGGELELVRSDGEWTEFALKLPAAEAPVLNLTPPVLSIAAA